VVLWDTTNSLGESGGRMEDGTTTTYYHDLEDVISWAKDKKWYEEPFVLCGHSLGGISILIYAEKYPEKVKSLVPISSVISGELSLEVKPPKELEEWKKRGFIIEKSVSKPGVSKKIKWEYIEDRNMYDALKEVNKLVMPVLLIVGEEDKVTPSKHQQILLDAIPGNNKQLHIIKGAPHTFREEKQFREIQAILKNWIKSLE
jgi:pimeloyl-ACP methyl ester carboxylesterase